LQSGMASAVWLREASVGAYNILVDKVVVLRQLAAKYIWWKMPDEAVRYPRRIITQVMNIGDYGDVQAMAHALGDAVLKDALATTEAGELSERSWVYWHLRLGLCSTPEDCPPLPARRVQ